METVNVPPPQQAAPLAPDHAAWNEANQRLRQYLGAFQLSSHLHADDLADEILERAQQRHQQEPHRLPLTLTMEEAFAKMEGWFGGLLKEKDLAENRRSAHGRVAVWITRAHERWPLAVGSDDVPGDLLAAVRESTVQTGPDLEVSSMTSRGMDFGAMETLARETWQRWEWGEITKAALFWFLIYLTGYFLIINFL